MNEFALHRQMRNPDPGGLTMRLRCPPMRSAKIRANRATLRSRSYFSITRAAARYTKTAAQVGIVD